MEEASRLRGSSVEKLERETGVEPATSTLARSRSTTELLPLGVSDYKQRDNLAAMTPPTSYLILRAGALLLHGFVGRRCDPVPDVPEILIKQMFHALMQNFHWSPHRTYHPPADNPMGQHEVME